MSRKLILIGGIHTDVKGESRLFNAVEQLNPSDLSIEGLESSIQMPQRTIDEILGSIKCYMGLAITDETLAKFAGYLGTYVYEIKVAETLKRKWKPKVHLVDVYIPKAVPDRSSDLKYLKAAAEEPELIRELNDRTESIYSHLVEGIGIPKRLAALAAQYLALTFYDDVRKSAIDAHNYQGPHAFKDANVRLETEQRDTHMEGKIRELWNRAGKIRDAGDFMHFGGIIHVFGDYNNLFERLRDLKPVRYRLNQF